MQQHNLLGSAVETFQEGYGFEQGGGSGVHESWYAGRDGLCGAEYPEAEARAVAQPRNQELTEPTLDLPLLHRGAGSDVAGSVRTGPELQQGMKHCVRAVLFLALMCGSWADVHSFSPCVEPAFQTWQLVQLVCAHDAYPYACGLTRKSLFRKGVFL
ncbi:hypothetical protein PUR49_11055 [Streptomyces sp. BE147]|uniref:hypothetical protein n=1 Tax=Streptomyces sp. BE147 TaxID=3002524 RepID=UPI002E760EF5|nr:hypothetical protein [Streptomyces sp. BE147]MEE1737034.1 hypothetical protein [Streptomyces sp. BE147]